MDLTTSFQELFKPGVVASAAWGFAASFVLCLLLVATKQWHGALTLDSTYGVQKFHTDPTPRVGGLPIVLGLAVSWWLAPVEVRGILGPILLAGTPAFVFGLAEDITKRVSVMQRLLATMASGALACLITGNILQRVDVWPVDAVLQWLPLAGVLFTAFAVGGVANAINIIDGFNGLAGSMAAMAYLGFALLGLAQGDMPLAATCLILAAGTLGFFWVNWPFGKIFLGDGGSYFTGFSLAWVSVLLVNRNPHVAAFAALLICAHPINEVLFTIYRRKVRREHPGMPDRLHFHSLFKRRYVDRWLAAWPAGLRNSAAGLSLGLLTVPPVLVAFWVHESAVACVVAYLIVSLGYVALYARMVRHQWYSPVSFLFARRMVRANQA